MKRNGVGMSSVENYGKYHHIFHNHNKVPLRSLAD